MTDEQKQINRRVAVKLGYDVVKDPYATWGYYLKPPTGRPYHVSVKSSPEAAWRSCCDFTADPAAADLVRLEIERRGGEMDTYNRQRGEVRHRGADVRFGLGQWHRGESDSPHMALCLAFLAACEANAEAGRAGETMIADVDAAQFSRQKQVHYQVNRANAALLSAAPDMVEALECAEDAETIRHVTVLGDEFHAICDKWRARAEEILADRYPMEERFPGWVGSAMRELSQETRRLALIKAKGQTT